MDTTKLNILIADGDDHARAQIADILARDGHRCDAVSNGRDCLKQLALKTFDLLLLDIVLPEMDGEHVMMAMQGRYPGTDVAVISSQDAEDVIKEMIDLGAIAYLVKPSDPSAYAAFVNEISADRQKRSTQAGIQTDNLLQNN